MPIYEYCCKDCEQIFEEWQRNHDEVEATCPVCGGEAQRIISNTSFVLKGTGWYVTDYANGRSTGSGSATSDAASGGNGDGDKSTAKADTSSAGSESKSESSTPPAASGGTASKADSSAAQS
ncbi:FmdB family zinc ribbon protein [Desulfovibrio ferrophilus]|uniref:FmdB family regulatory protein n=1 Tax=Desulfovibrio ferrophilus TaxID=241368 RepID=A0A2Z6B1Z2_9BACT|nr:zinc ribbon domain-containing protein [Desulfovibrio ferrophilus]BBD09473.1 FmdB family regulatory protein [Desulfovibrio ferrophilus]